MKQSKRKLKKAGTVSPNPKKHKATLPRDELVQRCSTVLDLSIETNTYMNRIFSLMQVSHTNTGYCIT